MPKTYHLTGLALAAVLSLSACSGEKPTPDPSPDSPYYVGEAPEEGALETPGSDTSGPSDEGDGESEEGSSGANGSEEDPSESPDPDTNVEGEEAPEGSNVRVFGLVTAEDGVTPSLTPEGRSRDVGKLTSQLRPSVTKYFEAYFSQNKVGENVTNDYLHSDASPLASNVAFAPRFFPSGGPAKNLVMTSRPKGSNAALVYVGLVVTPPDSTMPDELYRFKMEWVKEGAGWGLQKLTFVPG